MTLPTYTSLKKTYLYNFFLDKETEERSSINSNMFGPRMNRELVEIRDVHPPPVFNPQQPWQIQKNLHPFEISSGKIVVSFQDTFEYILRHWNLNMAKSITTWGNKIMVTLWDVTNEENPRKYEGNLVYFERTPIDNFLLGCTEMMRDRKLKVGDSIGLSWESNESFFRIKLLSTSAR